MKVSALCSDHQLIHCASPKSNHQFPSWLSTDPLIKQTNYTKDKALLHDPRTEDTKTCNEESVMYRGPRQKIRVIITKQYHLTTGRSIIQPHRVTELSGNIFFAVWQQWAVKRHTRLGHQLSDI